MGLDLRYHDQIHGVTETYPMGICGSLGSYSKMLPVREVAMMIIMDRLTDKSDWHIKVFNEIIAEKWIEEALALPVDPLYDEIVESGPDKRLKTILDRKCHEYCIEELRVKAKFFEKTHLIPTLDSSASVVKSDAAFAKLKLEQKDDPDWHPNTNDMVQNLVHPSLYPLVYGRSRVFRQEVVGVEDAVDRWSGKGEIIPGNPQLDPMTGRYDDRVDDSHWSDNYQWLPSNVSFQDDGSVKFTSYINGLHPTKHREIYATIEKLIENAIPAWDLCLPYYRDGKAIGAGRTEPRLGEPAYLHDSYSGNWDISINDAPVRNETTKKQEIYDRTYDYHYDWEDYDRQQWEDWEKMREPVQPEAPYFRPWDYGIKPGESLRDCFRDIQVIVKMASIELTPDKPTFPAGGWHIEGQMNEHIVGTALYYLDSENVTPSFLKFRMQTDPYQPMQDYTKQDSGHEYLGQIYGTHMLGGHCLQQYGSVETKQGRLLAFPNVFHHRVSPFELKDKIKPGHRRFIALWLVDPHTRIINTGNVPPQQQSWWLEQTFGNMDPEKILHPLAKLVSEATPDHPHPVIRAAIEKGNPLPVELQDMVQEEAGEFDMPMTLQEAKEHRLRLMKERTWTGHKMDREWQWPKYSFCEH